MSDVEGTMRRRIRPTAADDRVRPAQASALALAAYQSGRGDLAAVITARAQAAELMLRAAEIELRRHTLRVRLNTLNDK